MYQCAQRHLLVPNICKESWILIIFYSLSNNPYWIAWFFVHQKYQHVNKTSCISEPRTNVIILHLVTNKLNHSNTMFRAKKSPGPKDKHWRLAITELIGIGKETKYIQNVYGKSQLTMRQDKSEIIFFMAMFLIMIYLVVLVWYLWHITKIINFVEIIAHQARRRKLGQVFMTG